MAARSKGKASPYSAPGAHRVQFVAITFDDGTVGIMQFLLDPRLPARQHVIGFDGTARKASDEAIEFEVAKTDWGAVKPLRWRRMPFSEIPQDRTFRNAWHDHPTRGVEVHMPRAREIARTMIREQRSSAMAALDVEYMRSLERGDDSARNKVTARKQQWRDAPADAALERAKTPEQLKAAVAKIVKAGERAPAKP